MGRYEDLARAAKLEAEPLRNPATILISVVVPAYKEATSVLRTIRHATEQMGTQLRTEFFVAAVDDETAQRVEESELPITVVRCSSGRSSALNAGAALARGEVLPTPTPRGNRGSNRSASTYGVRDATCPISTG